MNSLIKLLIASKKLAVFIVQNLLLEKKRFSFIVSFSIFTILVTCPEKASGAKCVGNPVEVVGRGNTGRIKPNTLSEQMAMHEVMSNPLKNATELPIKMKDTRWPFEDGWVKMQNNVKLSNGDTISIHYVYI